MIDIYTVFIVVTCLPDTTFQQNFLFFLVFCTWGTE